MGYPPIILHGPALSMWLSSQPDVVYRLGNSGACHTILYSVYSRLQRIEDLLDLVFQSL